METEVEEMGQSLDGIFLIHMTWKWHFLWRKQLDGIQRTQRNTESWEISEWTGALTADAVAQTTWHGLNDLLWSLMQGCSFPNWQNALIGSPSERLALHWQIQWRRACNHWHPFPKSSSFLLALSSAASFWLAKEQCVVKCEAQLLVLCGKSLRNLFR